MEKSGSTVRRRVFQERRRSRNNTSVSASKTGPHNGAGIERCRGDHHGCRDRDLGEKLNVTLMFPCVLDGALKAIVDYERSIKQHPNPPAPNVTRFRAGG
jgi:hypothetical protein